MRLFIRNIICIVAVAAATFGCTTNDCPLNNTVSLVCGFYNSADGNPLGIADTLTITIRDSVVLNRAVGAATVSLPMSYAAEADTLVLNYTPEGTTASAADILIVSKTNQPHVISLECGTRVFHTITGATNHAPRTPDATYRYAVDSVVVSNPNVNFDGQENLKIYYTIFQ